VQKKQSSTGFADSAFAPKELKGKGGFGLAAGFLTLLKNPY